MAGETDMRQRYYFYLSVKTYLHLKLYGRKHCDGRSGSSLEQKTSRKKKDKRTTRGTNVAAGTRTGKDDAGRVEPDRGRKHAEQLRRERSVA